MFLRIVTLLITRDIEHDGLISVIPSTYYIGRMYDNKSCKFLIKVDTDKDDNPVVNFERLFIRFISGNVDLGSAEIFKSEESQEYEYELSAEYTQKDLLNIQLILNQDDGIEIRTNIVKFKLSNSLPKDIEFYNALSYLNRLIFDKLIKLEVNREDKELIILDDLDNELCSIDIGYMLGGDEIEDTSTWIGYKDCTRRTHCQW